MARTKLVAACAIVSTGVLAALANIPQPDPTRDIESLAQEFGGEMTFTRPGQDAEISFRVATQVMLVGVSLGDVVPEGTLLVQGDVGLEQAGLEFQKARAETDIPLRRAQQQHELAKVELKRLREMDAQGGTNEQELNRARVSAAIAAIDVEQAAWNGALELLRLRTFEENVRRISLRAPFDCHVVAVEVDVGDTMREGEPVVRVVSIDPLHIDVDAPLALALRRSVGDPAWALIGVPGDPKVMKGRVTAVSPVADFAARSLRIRIEIDNAQGLPAGLPAWVRFSEPSAQFQDMIVSAGTDQSVGG